MNRPSWYDAVLVCGLYVAAAITAINTAGWPAILFTVLTCLTWVWLMAIMVTIVSRVVREAKNAHKHWAEMERSSR